MLYAQRPQSLRAVIVWLLHGGIDLCLPTVNRTWSLREKKLIELRRQKLRGSGLGGPVGKQLLIGCVDPLPRNRALNLSRYQYRIKQTCSIATVSLARHSFLQSRLWCHLPALASAIKCRHTEHSFTVTCLKKDRPPQCIDLNLTSHNLSKTILTCGDSILGAPRKLQECHEDQQTQR